jgi:hypothetical protein
MSGAGTNVVKPIPGLWLWEAAFALLECTP